MPARCSTRSRISNSPIPTCRRARCCFRLFHESGVRLEPPRKLADKCTCSEEKLLTTLRPMPRDEILSLAEADGAIAADCQFCGRLYRFPATETI